MAFYILAVCGVLFIVEFPRSRVGLYRWLVKVSWLGKLVVGVLVGGAFSMEACVGVLVGGFFLSGVQ